MTLSKYLRPYQLLRNNRDAVVVIASEKNLQTPTPTLNKD
jgi:hypothetical protein